MKNKIKEWGNNSGICDSLYLLPLCIFILLMGALCLAIPILFITCAIAGANPDGFGSTEPDVYMGLCILLMPFVVGDLIFISSSISNIVAGD